MDGKERVDSVFLLVTVLWFAFFHLFVLKTVAKVRRTMCVRMYVIEYHARHYNFQNNFHL